MTFTLSVFINDMSMYMYICDVQEENEHDVGLVLAARQAIVRCAKCVRINRSMGDLEKRNNAASSENA